MSGWRIGTIVAVPAILAANNGAGSTAPPMMAAGGVLAGPVGGAVVGQRFCAESSPEVGSGGGSGFVFAVQLGWGVIGQ